MSLLDWLLSLWRKKPIDPPPPPSSGDMLRMHNQTRTARGVLPLAADARLDAAALAQASWMAQTQSLTHSGPGGNQVGDRARGAGYPWKAIAENVAAGPDVTAAQCFSEWMSDLAHALNATSARYADAGFGSAVGKDGFTYWSAVYGATK